MNSSYILVLASMTALERRRLLAVDLVASAEVPAGFYGVNDSISIDVTFTNLGTTKTNSGTSRPQVNLVLTQDKIIGNADDIAFGSTDVTSLAAGKSVTQAVNVNFQDGQAAGDYYVATIADQANAFVESDETNNVTFTDSTPIRIVTELLTNNTVLGTAGDDVISIESHGFNNILTVNNVSRKFGLTAFDHLFIDGGAGNDRIFANNDQVNLRLQITGSGGNDIIVGGNYGDELSGANGKDKIYGGAGDDYLLGGAANDYLSGEAGADIMSGAGGNDRLADVVGQDHFLGGAGNDVIISRDTNSTAFSDPDVVSGGMGADKAQIDTGIYPDQAAGVETFLP